MATQRCVAPTGTQEIGLDAVDPSLHLRLRISMEISGVDLDGSAFLEVTHTLVVAPTGAVLECNRSLGPDQELTVRLGKKEILSRVLGIAGPGESTYVYGISFMQPDARFWGVAFPNAVPVPGGTTCTAVQCSCCGQQRSYVLNEVESLVLKASGSLGLHCSACKDGTLWKLAGASTEHSGREHKEAGSPACESAAVRKEPEAAAEVLSLATSIQASHTPLKRANRRKHLRLATAQSKGCIKRPDGEKIVDLLNVSRSGALFRSDSALPLGAWVRIAAPYTLGANNIFVLARIVRIEATDSWREYGVEYAHQ